MQGRIGRKGENFGEGINRRDEESDTIQISGHRVYFLQ